jgi:hypothetical protein
MNRTIAPWAVAVLSLLLVAAHAAARRARRRSAEY